MQVQWRGELLFISAGSFRCSRSKCGGRDGWGAGAGLEWVRAIWTRHIRRTNRILGCQNISRTFCFFFCCFFESTTWNCSGCVSAAQNNANTRLVSHLISTHTQPWAAGRAEQPALCCQIFASRKTPLHLHRVLLSNRKTSSHLWADHNKDECSWIWCYKRLVVVVVVSLAVSSCCVVFLPENDYFQKMLFFFSLLASFNRKGLMSQISRERFQGNRIVHCTAIWLLRLHLRISHQKIWNIGIMWNKPSLISNEVSNPNACIGCF